MDPLAQAKNFLNEREIPCSVESDGGLHIPRQRENGFDIEMHALGDEWDLVFYRDRDLSVSWIGNYHWGDEELLLEDFFKAFTPSTRLFECYKAGLCCYSVAEFLINNKWTPQGKSLSLFYTILFPIFFFVPAKKVYFSNS